MPNETHSKSAKASCLRQQAGSLRYPETEKTARVMAKLELQLEIIETQEHLWGLRAKAKRIQKAEVKRQISEVKR